MKLEEITSGMSLEGVEPSSVVTVVAAIAIAPASLQLVYRLLTRSDEGLARSATVTGPWSFAGDGAAFQLFVEAKRIDFVFDAAHVKNPFRAESGWGVLAVNVGIKALVERAERV